MTSQDGVRLQVFAKWGDECLFATEDVPYDAWKARVDTILGGPPTQVGQAEDGTVLYHRGNVFVAVEVVVKSAIDHMEGMVLDGFTYRNAGTVAKAIGREPS